MRLELRALKEGALPSRHDLVRGAVGTHHAEDLDADRLRAWLDAGHSVVIFPEGTRGEAGKITSFHRGVGRLLASRPGLAVIPAFLLGPERALPRQSTVPLPFWNHVFLGPPQHLSGDCHDITRALEEVIFGLARSETAARHRRRQVRRPAYVVAVLGIDGSGKSTLTSRLATTMSGGDAAAGSTCLIGDELQLFRAGERAAVQPLPAETLRAWVSRQAKQARSLALYKIPKLTELLLRDRLLAEVRRWYGPDLVFMDGSPLLNMVAWAVLYRDEALDVEVCGRAIGILSGRIDGVPKNDSIYQRLPELAPMVRLGLTRLALPDAVLFLDVEPEVAMTRIESRGERMQAHETAAQLGKLRAAYLQVMAAVGAEFSRTTLVLDGGQEPEAVAAAAARCITAARREMSGEERD